MPAPWKEGWLLYDNHGDPFPFARGKHAEDDRVKAIRDALVPGGMSEHQPSQAPPQLNFLFQ